MIETARLQLWQCTIDYLEALIEGDDHFQTQFGISISPGFVEQEHREVLEYSLNKLREKPDTARWLSYLIIHKAERKLIGMGGYKGAPDELGCIEIGYGIAPAYRNNGFATETAKGLVEDALTDPSIHTIFAHTLAEVNASNHILLKIGMYHSGLVKDPEEGEVWQYRIDRMD